MSVDSLITELAEKGVRLALKDGRISVDAPRSAMTDELRARLKANKDALLAYLLDRTPPDIKPIPRNGDYVLSPGQERLWLVNKFGQDRGSYNVNAAFRINGALDVEKLRAAITALTVRHEVLRTDYPEQNGQPTVRLHGAIEPDFQTVPVDDVDRSQDDLIAAMTEPFDLASALLARWRLFEAGSEARLLITLHHIIVDYDSLQILMRELIMLYAGGELAANGDALQMIDVAAWQRETLSPGRVAHHLSYWKTRLGREHPVLALPLCADRRPDQMGARHDLPMLEGDRLHRLTETCKRLGVTPHNVLLAAYAKTLSRWTGQSDIRIALPITERENPALAGVIGFLVNNQIVRVDLRPGDRSETFIKSVAQQTAEGRAHAVIPYEQLVEALEDTRDESREPLAQTQFNFLRRSDAGSVNLGDVTFEAEEAADYRSKYPLSLIAIQQPTGEISLALRHRPEQFSTNQVAAFGQGLRDVIDQITDPANTHLGDQSEDAPSKSSLGSISDYGEFIPMGSYLCGSAFDPDLPAIGWLDGDDHQLLSRAELEARSNRLAHHLISLGVERGERVCLDMLRGPEMMLGLLGVLKAGAAYVPLEQSQPAARRRYMAEAARARFVLYQAGTTPDLGDAIQFVMVDAAVSCAADQPETPPDVSITPYDIAYVMFTSGSTGQPKGVAVPHAGLWNRLRWMQEDFAFGPGDRTLQKTPYGFDVSVSELFLPLLAGSELVFAPPEAHKDPVALKKLVDQFDITTIHFVPSMLAAFVDAFEGEAAPLCSSLKRVICTGEAFSEDLGRRAIKLLGCGIYNLYGPTEASIEVTHWDMAEPTPEGPPASSAPIGPVISNMAAYVLDQHLQPVPEGVAGELYLSGVGLAHGYERRPDLTAAAFLPNPFAADPSHSRMYRTGDLARWRGGVLEYLSRVDFQVKLRGQRIELGEIEAVLEQFDSVSRAAVTVYAARGAEHLAAFIQPSADMPTDDALRDHLTERLPAYMIPTQFIVLEEMPLTANGKLDRKALPIPGNAASSGEPPKPGDEKTLAAIWADLLSIETVYREDNFFALGGDSIKGLMMISRAGEAGLFLEPEALFRNQTIARLAAAAVPHADGVEASGFPDAQSLDDALSVSASRLVLSPEDLSALETQSAPFDMSAVHRLAPIQQGMLLASGEDRYISQTLMRVTGPIETGRLQSVIRQVIARHSILRTAFQQLGDGTPFQVTLDEIGFALKFEDWRGMGEKLQARMLSEMREREAASFDLTRPPLFRCQLIQTDDDAFTMVWTVHHLIMDGWSLNVLFTEAMSLYAGLGELPAVPGFEAYVDWLATRKTEADQAYWTGRFDGYSGEPDIPARRIGDKSHESTGDQSLELGHSLSEALRTLARSNEISLASLVQCAWGLVLSRVFGALDICYGVTQALRPPGLTGIERMIGPMIGTVPMRMQLDPTAPVSEWLKSHHAIALESQAFAHAGLGQIQQWAGSGSSLFESLMVFENVPETALFGDTTAEALGFSVDVDDIQIRNSYPFTLRVVPREAIRLDLLLDHELVDPDLALTITHQLEEVLKSLVSGEARSVGDLIPIAAGVTPHDGSVGSASPLPLNVIEETPGHLTALSSATGDTDYETLRKQAASWASYFQTRGIGQGDIVAIESGRTADQITIKLAVWLTGAAWLCLDPKLPVGRRRQMVELSGAVAVIGDNDDYGDITKLPIAPAPPGSVGHWQVPQDHSGNDPAYIVFTSGSTGQPKGVVIPHGAIAAYASGLLNRLQIAPHSGLRHTTLATVSADLGLTAEFGALLGGGTLALIDVDLDEDPNLLADALKGADIDVLKITPSHLSALLSVEVPKRVLPRKKLVLGGEAASPGLLRSILAIAPELEIYNHYGPTETTVGALATRISDADIASGQIPLGEPFGEMQAHILDEAILPVGIGGTGELYLSGPQLASGYLGNMHETAVRFIPSGSGRMYRTGDRVRRGSDGTLYFAGREDSQIKIRGYRVEPGEVSRVLQSLDGVNAAHVTSLEGITGLTLAGVISGTLDIDSARAQLSERLPDYMVPSQLKAVPSIPLTPNGKINTDAVKALFQDQTPSAAAQETATKISSDFSALWCELLRIDEASAEDHFFSLGGDSIIAIQLSARAKRLGLMLTPRLVFEHPVLGDLMREIGTDVSELAQSKSALSQPVESDDPFGLTPIQNWFFESNQPHPDHWNQAIMVRLDASPGIEACRLACSALLDAHPMLRARFEPQNGKWSQLIGEASANAFRHVDLSSEEDAETRLSDEAQALQASLSISEGPIFRMMLADMPGNKAALMLVAHHLVVDGISWRILLSDLLLMMTGQGEPQAESTSFADWQKYLCHAPEDVLERAEAYWWPLTSRPDLGVIATDIDPGEAGDIERASVSFDQKILTQLANQTETSVQAVLLSALADALRDQIGRREFIVEAEGHGRESELDLSTTVGW
ncbi:MAG: amino acid adenylation domain-containing protein, partial [Pseudomonadota bacterium]